MIDPVVFHIVWFMVGLAMMGIPLFFLAKFDDATKLYNYLVNCGVIVRNRSSVKLCGNCLRITVGSQSENSLLLSAMRKYKH